MCLAANTMFTFSSYCHLCFSPNLPDGYGVSNEQQEFHSGKCFISLRYRPCNALIQMRQALKWLEQLQNAQQSRVIKSLILRPSAILVLWLKRLLQPWVFSSGCPKVKSRKKKPEVTQTKQETVSHKPTGPLKGKSRRKSRPSQESQKNPFESTLSPEEPCLASTPVRGSYSDRVPQILQSPVKTNQESAGALTPLKVFIQILHFDLFLRSENSNRLTLLAETRD